MQENVLNDNSKDEIERLLLFIPFFRQIKSGDPQQFQTLIAFSKVIRVNTGESIFSIGSEDRWLFFLVRGELSVQVVDETQKLVNVNSITAGEVFGDLAMLLGRPRTASITVAESCKQAIVFGLDFNAFGALTDFSLVYLNTKLAFYRYAVHSLRWKLEVYRNKHPKHSLASQHRKLKIYNGPIDTIEELQSLHSQAVGMAAMLTSWNQAFCSFHDSSQ